MLNINKRWKRQCSNIT